MEGLIDVLTSHGTHREELAIIVFLEFVDLGFESVKQLLQIEGCEFVGLVPEQHFGYIVATVDHYQFKPIAHILEGTLVGQVENYDRSLGQVEVGIDNSPVPLLAGSVPDLEGEGVLAGGDLLEAVVDGHGGSLHHVLVVQVADQDAALAHARLADYDGLLVGQLASLICHVLYLSLTLL